MKPRAQIGRSLAYASPGGPPPLGAASDAAALFLLERFTLPRLTRAAFGPVGSDARVALLRRTLPAPGAARPPTFTHGAAFNHGGKAYRVGGRTFSGVGGWSVVPAAAELWCFDPKRTARASGGDGSNDPWRLVPCKGPAPSPRCSASAATLGARVLVWGGAQGSLGRTSLCNAKEVFVLDLAATPPGAHKPATHPI